MKIAFTPLTMVLSKIPVSGNHLPLQLLDTITGLVWVVGVTSNLAVVSFQ